MNILKYIINKKNNPVLFSRDIQHNTLNQEANSAGFIILKYDSLANRFVAKCFGESDTLMLKSNPEIDEKLIETFLNNFSESKIIPKQEKEKLYA
jgi:hypothetical protein